MKKFACTVVFLLTTILLAGAQKGFAYQDFTSTPNGGCLQCHAFAGGGPAHNTHWTALNYDCTPCHLNGVHAKNVTSSTCAACHPAANPGNCQIINSIQANHPKTGANSCYSCHTACVDSDRDSIANAADNCPNVYNLQQLDADSDGSGDVCDTTPGCGGCGQSACEPLQTDSDNDGIADVADNCQNLCNSQQLDADNDGVGDVCDTTPGCGGCGQFSCEVVCKP
jgi:hypothetical protein